MLLGSIWESVSPHCMNFIVGLFFMKMNAKFITKKTIADAIYNYSIL